jgi:hypothetical protein
MGEPAGRHFTGLVWHVRRSVDWGGNNFDDYLFYDAICPSGKIFRIPHNNTINRNPCHIDYSGRYDLARLARISSDKKISPLESETAGLLKNLPFAV